MTSIKKEYIQGFENKDEDWRKKHDYKNLKDLGYQAEKDEKDETNDEEEETIPEWELREIIIFMQLREIIFGPIIYDDEQPDSIDLESEESVEQRNKEGQVLEILTPNQMLSRLPITLAQLKAGNNSEKLKNEIRQLLYSFIVQRNCPKQSIII